MLGRQSDTQGQGDFRLRRSTVFTDVDLDRSGKQIGFFYVPKSPHDDAWGAVPVPLAVIKNGTGPTVLIESGNHGDEYEGAIALGELIRTLDPGEIQGRIIAIPAKNLPAVAAGRRTSPLDGLNFNRTFPGDPAGTINQQISAFVQDALFPVGRARPGNCCAVVAARYEWTRVP